MILQWLLPFLEEELCQAGEVLDVVLQSRRSLLTDEETQEAEIHFALSEDAVNSARIHLFVLGPLSLEVEAEVSYGTTGDPEALWKEAKAIIPDVAITERTRSLEPGLIAEREWTADFHFLLECASDEPHEEGKILLRNLVRDVCSLLRVRCE